VLTCKGDGTIEGFHPWRVGASFGTFASDVTFGDGIDPYIERRAVTASVEYHPNLDTTLQAGVGAGLGGRMTFERPRACAGSGRRCAPVRVDQTILPGWVATFAYSRRLMNGLGSKPFILLSISAGGSGAGTRGLEPTREEPAETLYAFDVRAGLTVGKTFFRTLSPYAAVRVFGGPIIWKLDGDTVMGTDTRHVQLAAGMLVSLPAELDAFAEVAPIFERGVTVGIGKSF
jgi:hypothetical protein